MADVDANSIAERINALANDAASKILACRDSANRDLATAREQANDLVDKIDKAIKRYDRQKLDSSELADKAAPLQSRLDAVESILDGVQDKAEAVADMIGKVVHLKSSPAMQMTAASIEGDGRILCMWMDGPVLAEAPIPFAALEVSSQEAAVKKHALDTPIQELGLSVRSLNCLLAEGMKTVGDVGSYLQLLKLPNMGKRGALEVQDRLRELGIEIPQYPNQ